MSSGLKLKIIDFSMIALMYLSLFSSWEYKYYAENLFHTLVWVFICLGVISIFAYQNEVVVNEFKKERKPKTKLDRLYTELYDFSFGAVLVSTGFISTGVIWWFVTYIVSATSNKIDDDIISENEK